MILRGTSLEYGDLVDPTESRYASVAQEMVLSNNWITPQLPSADKNYPYLGKPPLHYWLTAISYEVFRVDEWTSRLPSFISSLIIIFSFILIFPIRGNKAQPSNEFKNFGYLFLSSSALFFLFSGASVIDVTLTLFVTLTSLFLYKAYQTQKKYWFYLAAISSALSFLTKGPVGILLNGFAIILWSILERDSSYLKKIPYFRCLALLIFIVSPWFYLAERDNPGFLKYFFWNENFERYLKVDYGDMYGAGHIYPRGTGFLMFLVGALPWSPFFLIALYKWKDIILHKKLSGRGNFLLACTLSPVIFFSFARQLHFGYLIPAIPTFAFFLVDLLELYKNEKQFVLTSFYLSRIFQIIGFVVVGYLVFSGQQYFVIPIILSVIGYSIYLSSKYFFDKIELRQYCLSITVGTLAIYSAVLYPTLNLLDLSRSTKRILTAIVPTLPGGIPEIGVMTDNTFSHLWIGKNWQQELGRPVKYLDVRNQNNFPQYLLLETKTLKNLTPSYLDGYENKKNLGRWNWFEKKKS